LILAGVGPGILGALLGTGGGVFLIPLLVLAFDVPMHYAIATSIVSVIATSSAAASTNVEQGTANMRLGMTLEIATALGAILGGLTAAWLSAPVLEVLFSCVLLPTAWFMWRGREDADRHQTPEINATASEVPEPIGRLGGEYVDDALQTKVTYRVDRLWAGLLISFFAGNISGLLGIGGGVFKVPAIHLLCGVPIKAAAATSNFMIGVTAAASAFLYFGRGEVRPALTAAVVLGVLLGTALGSAISRRISATFLRHLFAVLLVVVALQMSIRAWWV
jgi:uncharacterized membrane protein YfcA